MNIKLVKLTHEYKNQLTDMLDEWKKDIIENKTNHSPWAIFKNDYNDFDYYLENLEVKEEKNGIVPDSTFFCLDLDRNIFVGAVNIRHYLNEKNYLTGGHIGDGIRPSERRKGYATAMIALALEECKKLGIYKVLMTCDKDNIGSKKSIINNGGVFESEVMDDGEIEKRYWITLKEETIETERLVLRRVMASDYKEMTAWTMDERVYKYLLGNPCKKPEDAMTFLRRNDPNSKKHYVFIEHAKEDGHAIGLIASVLNKETDTWSISYNCRYDDWGKGYTTEAAKAVMDYVRMNNGAHRFEAECANENIGSAKVMQKLGMKFDHYASYTKHDGSVTFESSVYILED